jgi:hypothetical protein
VGDAAGGDYSARDSREIVSGSGEAESGRESSALEGLDAHEELVVGGDFVFVFGAVIEVEASEATVGVHLDALALDELAAEGFEAVVLEVEGHLVPALLQFEGHGALEGLDTGDGLIVAADEGAPDVLVVQETHLEAEVLVELGEEGLHS